MTIVAVNQGERAWIILCERTKCSTEQMTVDTDIIEGLSRMGGSKLQKDILKVTQILLTPQNDFS